MGMNTKCIDIFIYIVALSFNEIDASGVHTANCKMVHKNLPNKVDISCRQFMMQFDSPYPVVWMIIQFCTARGYLPQCFLCSIKFHVISDIMSLTKFFLWSED